MSAKICFFIFIVPLTLCDDVFKRPQAPIDQQVLLNVFGLPQLSAPAPHIVQSAYPAHASNMAGSAPGGFQLGQAVAVTPSEQQSIMEEEEQYTQSSADYDKFDWILTKRVAASSDENFLLSPLGLKLALAILTEAATGVTRSELSSVLGFDLDQIAVRHKFATILGSLKTENSRYILNLGSRIYLEETVHPQQKFAGIAQEYYKTEFATATFSKPLVAAKEINSWVANVTDGRIHSLVDADDLESVVALVLTTLYFKGNWTHQFPLNSTKVGQFYVSPNVSKDAYFMNVRNKFYYGESLEYDAKILRLGYLGNKYSLYIALPNSLTGLSRLINTISVKNLRTEMLFLNERLVDVTLPKFQFDYTSVLDGVLQELGIRQAFQDSASFPGIARGQALPHRVKISKVLQRAGIEVNEVGSVAYAATEISLVNKFGDDGEILEEFIANKPFLFFIQDEVTRQLLFTGRVSDPSLIDGALKLN